MLSNGVRVENMFQLDVCTIQCNSSSIAIEKRSLEVLASKSKLPIEKTTHGTKDWAI